MGRTAVPMSGRLNGGVALTSLWSCPFSQLVLGEPAVVDPVTGRPWAEKEGEGSALKV